MPKRSSNRNKQGPEDPNEAASRITRAVTSPEPTQEAEPAKNPHAVALGRKGGQKGGAARAAKLSARRKKAIARKAAKARWAKSRGK